MRKSIFKLFSMTVFVLISLMVVGCTKEEIVNNYDASNAYVVIDINPSIEIITNDEGLVVQVTALNEDAEVLLVDVNLKNKTLSEAVEIIMELAKEMGYLNILDENAILFTVETETRSVEALLKHLKEKVDKFSKKHQFRIQCLIDQLSKDPQLVEEAKQLGISASKLALIKTAMEYDETLTIEVAKKMPVKEILAIIINARIELGELVGEDLNEYYQKQKQHVIDLILKNLELLNDAIANAKDEVLTTIIENSETTLEEVKALYLEYLNEVKAAIANFKAGSNDELNLEGQLLKAVVDRLLERIDQFDALNERLILEFGKLDEKLADYKTLKEQLKEQINDSRKDIAKVKAELKTAVEKFNNFLERNGKHRFPKGQFKFGYRFEKHLKDQNQGDLLNVIKAITKEYKDKFKAIGVDLEALEDLFKDEIKDIFDNFKHEASLNLKQTKEQLRANSELFKEELRLKKENLKKLYR